MSTDAVQTVITAAKDSRSLFFSAGFDRPKSVIRWRGREVLLRAMDSYVINQDACWVALNEDENREWSISETVTDHFPHAKITVVPSAAKGALASALLAMEGVHRDLPLVVAAGDSYLQGGIGEHVKQFVIDGVSAGTIAFEAHHPRWSYLAIGTNGVVRQVAEKRVIGPLATTGVFFFRRAGDFLDAASWCLVNNAQLNGNFYASTTLNYMISQNQSVTFRTVSASDYRSWSLPVDFTEGVLDS